ncbi:MAG: hypothetical protein A2Y78_01020 [Acidobacteria bacterium RBG_13_68_16]|nr:MAG: hypothetical protein A2Y78_01020 [Acidobacteria bacterium RBG_13_68_16]
MKQRPNLASSPLPDVRPVLVVGVALALVAVVLTGISLGEFIRARGTEKAATSALVRLQARRSELATKVGANNRRLASVGWKALQAETVAMQEVVARRTLVWSQLLAEFERLVPWDIRLVSIAPTIDKNGSVLVGLSGVAASREAWLKLIALLFVDRKFSEPLPTAEESPSATNGQGHRFSLTVRYWPEGRP